MSVKIGSSFSSVFTSLSSPFQSKKARMISSRLRLLDMQHFGADTASNDKCRSYKLMHGKLRMHGSFSKRQFNFFAISSEDQLLDSELESDASEQGSPEPFIEDFSADASNVEAERLGGGRPGLISFYNHPYRREDELIVSNGGKNESTLLWVVGPAVLIASFIVPSVYLRRIISTIFEDSLLTDFLILFFTEALFYCGVAIFLLLIHHLRRPLELVSSACNRNITPPPLGYRISSVAILGLSLTIPMVTMGFVWPWTGPAASATLAPYLVGIVVQFAFEQYARYVKSPSRPVIPVVFQVYRLHQLNRAAQLVTALSFTVRGAESTPHNLAINSSLGALLNVLQILGVICIWSLSSFVMRYFPSINMTEG
nr:Telomere length regulator taz1 like [Ipomoea batatas]